MVDANIREKVLKSLEEKPEIMPYEIGRRFGVSENEVLSCLPRPMCIPVPVRDFEIIWERLAALTKITYVSRSPGIVTEWVGRLPALTEYRGMLNMQQTDCSLKGHIFRTEIGDLWLVDKPFFGLRSLSLQVMHQSGNAMFGIYAGRENRELLDDGLALFEILQRQYGTNEVESDRESSGAPL